MAHVYEGAPDGRQAGDITPSRFRPRYRALTDAEKALHDHIKAKAAEMEALFKQAYDLAVPPLEQAMPVPAGIPSCADGCVLAAPGEAAFGELISVSPFDGEPKFDYFADGLKHLELSVMWTVKGLTA